MNPVMVRLRSILVMIVAIVASVFLICSNPAEAARSAKPYVYTPEQLEQIQRYTGDIEELRDRMLEIPTLIQQQRWIDVKTFIHGPLGELRVKMARLARSLDPKMQKTAQAAAKEVFEHLILIDEAADARDTTKAFRNYNEALKDLDAFFDLIPA
jgi:photosystem II protein PsbQ